MLFKTHSDPDKIFLFSEGGGRPPPIYVPPPNFQPQPPIFRPQPQPPIILAPPPRPVLKKRRRVFGGIPIKITFINLYLKDSKYFAFKIMFEISCKS